MDWTRELKWGMKGEDVRQLHDLLFDIFDFWGDKFAKQVPLGSKLYSLQTKRCVEHYQRVVDIPITGRVDQNTWEWMEWSYSVYDNYYFGKSGKAYENYAG